MLLDVWLCVMSWVSVCLYFWSVVLCPVLRAEPACIKLVDVCFWFEWLTHPSRSWLTHYRTHYFTYISYLAGWTMVVLLFSFEKWPVVVNVLCMFQWNANLLSTIICWTKQLHSTIWLDIPLWAWQSPTQCEEDFCTNEGVFSLRKVPDLKISHVHVRYTH